MYDLIFWFLFIIIVIIAIIVLVFSHVKQFALFQATRDQKWYPHADKNPEYSKGFTDNYLIIEDTNHK